jgi:serine protease Do
MKRIQNVLFAALLAFVGGIISVVVYTTYFEKDRVVTITEKQPVQLASFSSNESLPDLTYAAENSVKAVVHIQTEYKQQGYSGSSIFDFFFGNPYQNQEPRIQQASGSGVIISTDGYIVTNNHVIESSDKITVTLNDNRKFEAKKIGSDPSSDIALIKIEAEDIPCIRWGDSELLKLGEWVLAVGNPFNLTSTVTAGIVSAKGRGNLGIIGGQVPIESFIQTDAAVNPGNSGGALVNIRGELIGINTAIASRTGSYTGYSFAVPVSIVRKVVEDLKIYGEVQRALLGIIIQQVDSDVAKENNLDKIEGIYIVNVEPDGAAKSAGIEPGDVLLSINGVRVNSLSELQEQLGKHRPGDNVKVLVKRKNKEKLFDVTLRNTRGGTGIIKDSMTVLGAGLEKVDDKTKEKLRIRTGLKVKELSKGKLKDAGVREGFIITRVNKQNVDTIERVKEVLKMSSGGVLIEGIYPNGEEAYYVFGIE